MVTAARKSSILPFRFLTLLFAGVFACSMLSGRSAVAADTRTTDPLSSAYYALESQGTVIGYFTSVGGIGSENEIVEQKVSSKGVQVVQKVPGRLKWLDVNLTRGITDDLKLWEWRTMVETGNIKNARKDFCIIMYDQEFSEAARWNFVNGWPVMIDAPELKDPVNSTTAIGVETLVIAHEGCTREAVTTTVRPTSTTTVPHPETTSTTTVPHPETTSTTTGSHPITTSTTSVQQSTSTTTIETTAVTLASFEAQSGNAMVILVWETGDETNNFGFNIYRAESEDGDYVKINDAIIKSQADSGSGAEYEYVDSDVKNRGTYFYKLEDIDVNGISTFHGPLSATPRLLYGR